MDLLIVYLTDKNRHHTFSHFLRLLNESAYQHRWSLLVLTNDYDSSFYSSQLVNYHFNTCVVQVSQHNNYMVKILSGLKVAKEQGIPYIMKCDNDIFFRGKTLDFMLDNLHLLDENNLTLGPVISSGIPSAQYFIEDFLSPEDTRTLHNVYLKTQFGPLWGANYTPLNSCTVNAYMWNEKNFFDTVKQIPHHYKGVHPIRLNNDALYFLNSCVVKNRHKFFEDPSPMTVIGDDNSPYLCNSLFCIKRSEYEKIVSDQTLFVDPFDEVPLNKYAEKMGMNHLYIKNGYGIHMYYNTVPDHIRKEQEFCRQFFPL